MPTKAVAFTAMVTVVPLLVSQSAPAVHWFAALLGLVMVARVGLGDETDIW